MLEHNAITNYLLGFVGFCLIIVYNLDNNVYMVI